MLRSDHTPIHLLRIDWTALKCGDVTGFWSGGPEGWIVGGQRKTTNLFSAPGRCRSQGDWGGEVQPMGWNGHDGFLWWPRT